MGRADLTDAEWAVLEPLLPRGRKCQRSRGARRNMRNGSSLTGSGGGPGPARHGRTCRHATGPWQTVYGLFRLWQRNGTWRNILTALQAGADAAGLITWDATVDSTVAGAPARGRRAQARGPAGQAARRCGRRARRSRPEP